VVKKPTVSGAGAQVLFDVNLAPAHNGKKRKMQDARQKMKDERRKERKSIVHRIVSFYINATYSEARC
jgi:hypothetical protein